MAIRSRSIEERKLKQQSRIAIRDGAPSKAEGSDGEITIRKVKNC